jgi:hypothetical protein
MYSPMAKYVVVFARFAYIHIDIHIYIHVYDRMCVCTHVYIYPAFKEDSVLLPLAFHVYHWPARRIVFLYHGPARCTIGLQGIPVACKVYHWLARCTKTCILGVPLACKEDSVSVLGTLRC